MAGNNRFVVDASFVLSILLPDEKTKTKAKKYLNLILDSKNAILSTHLLEFEVGNGLRSAVLRKRLKKDSLKTLSKNFKLLPITSKEVDFYKTLTFAVDENISFYDTSYIFLAKSQGAKLLTLDKQLSELAEN